MFLLENKMLQFRRRIAVWVMRSVAIVVVLSIGCAHKIFFIFFKQFDSHVVCCLGLVTISNPVEVEKERKATKVN